MYSGVNKIKLVKIIIRYQRNVLWHHSPVTNFLLFEMNYILGVICWRGLSVLTTLAGSVEGTVTFLDIILVFVLRAVIRPVLVRVVLDSPTGLAMVGATVGMEPIFCVRSSGTRRGACRAAVRLGAGAAARVRTFFVHVVSFLTSRALVRLLLDPRPSLDHGQGSGHQGGHGDHKNNRNDTHDCHDNCPGDGDYVRSVCRHDDCPGAPS